MTEQKEYFQFLRQYVGTKPLILPGSVVIVSNSNKEVLLQKRPEGRWGLPGGLMNLGESFEEVAIREVLEETGLLIQNIEMLHVFSGKDYYTKTPNGDEFYSVTAVFFTREYEGQLTIDDDETVDIRYFSCDNLPENMVGSHRQFIKTFRKKVVNGS